MNKCKQTQNRIQRFRSHRTHNLQNCVINNFKLILKNNANFLKDKIISLYNFLKGELIFLSYEHS